MAVLTASQYLTLGCCQRAWVSQGNVMPATRTRKPAKTSHYAGVHPAARCDAAASPAAWTRATKIAAKKDLCLGMVACARARAAWWPSSDIGVGRRACAESAARALAA